MILAEKWVLLLRMPENFVILQGKIKGANTMKVIDKDGNVLYEGEQKHRERAFLGTARIRRKANWVRKPYKVVSKEDFDAGLY